MSSSLGTNQKARNESKALGWIVGYSEVIQTAFWQVETATGWPCLAVSRAYPKLTRYPFLI